MLTDEFLDKFDKQILTFEECKELSHFLDFQSTENSTFTDIENSYGYQIFKIIIFTYIRVTRTNINTRKYTRHH